MKGKELDGVEVCKELEDVLAPRLKLPVLDRSVYSHLLRHSRFEGKPRLRFSILWLAHNLGITARRARESVRRLVDKEVLRLVERSNIGHVVEVRLPREVPSARDGRTGIASRAKVQGEVHLDELPAPDSPPRALPGPRCASRTVRKQFVPQPRLLLPQLQLPEERPPRRGFSAPAFPRGPLVRQRPQRTPARRPGSRGWQAAATGLQRRERRRRGRRKE